MTSTSPPGTENDGAIRGWLAVAAVALAAVVIGFAAGWMLRGDGGGFPVTDAPPIGESTDAPAAPEPAPDPPAPLADRSETRVVVLNGLGVAGAASALAETAADAGYTDIDVGDTERTTDPRTVYHLGAPRLADRLARDLGLSAIRRRPDDLAPGTGADVVVVVGPG